MINQLELSIIDVKKELEDKVKREKMELFFQDKKFVKMVLEDIKRKTDKWLKCYYQHIEETKEGNVNYRKYQPESIVSDPIAYCKKTAKDIIAIRISTGLSFPEFFAELCIEHQFLIPDDRVGYVANQKLLEAKNDLYVKI